MKIQSVKSTNIGGVGYDDATRTLRVVFTSGATYDYPNVSPEAHRALIDADSIGAHFNQHIKPHHKGEKQ